MTDDFMKTADKRCFLSKCSAWCGYIFIIALTGILGWLYIFITNNWNDWSFTFLSCLLPCQKSSFSFSGMWFFIISGVLLASAPCIQTTFLFKSRTSKPISKLGHVLTLFIPTLLVMLWQWHNSYNTLCYTVIILDSISVSLFIFFGFLIASMLNYFGTNINKKLEKLENQKYVEAPEKDITKDIVGIESLFEEIAQKLKSGNNVSLTGPYGSGKSTVVYHVRKHLETVEDLGFATVGLWGLQTKNAVNAIISGIIEAAEERGVDTITVRNLPNAIASCISNAHWTLSLGCTLLRSGNETAFNMLKRCDRLLAANGLRVIICVEDIERCSSQVDASVINDLLDHLKNMSCVSLFVTYVDKKDDGASDNPVFIRERICNTHRLMPRMRSEKVWKRIEDLRADCLKVCEQKEDLLESNSDLKKRLKNISLDDSLLEEAESEYVGAIVHLLGTPRTLKRVFKRIEDSWQKSLHGEVAFWDLLVMTTLREVNESIFGHFVDNRHMFIKGNISCTKDELDKKLKVFEENPIIHKLLSPIFPYLRSEDYDSKVMSRKIFAKAERDHLALINNPDLIWPRIYEMRVPDNQRPIQDVLKESIRLIKDEKNALLERIQNDDQFSSLMSEYAGPHIAKEDLQSFLPVVLNTCINQMSGAESRCSHVWSNICTLWDWTNVNGYAVTTFLDKLFPKSCGIATILVDDLHSMGSVGYVVPVANAVFKRLPSNPKGMLKFLHHVSSEEKIQDLTLFIRKLRGASSYKFDDIYGRFFKLLASCERKTRYRDTIMSLMVHLTYYEMKTFETISYEPVANNFLSEEEVESILSRLQKWYNSSKNSHSKAEYELTIRLLGHILDSPKNLKLWKSRLTVLPKDEKKAANDQPE